MVSFAIPRKRTMTRSFESEAGAVSVSIPTDVSLLLWEKRRGIGMIMIGAFVVGLAAALLWPSSYRSSASFIPEQSSQSARLAGLGGLASQFGVSLGGDPMQSGRFYADILLSRRVIEQVLLGSYPSQLGLNAGRDSIPLLDILGIKGRDSLERVQKGVKKLRGMTSADADVRTNIVSISVQAKSPALAAAIANRFVETVNDFNTKTRQSQAGRRRVFIDQQTDSAESELRVAEDRLKTFYQQNRSWAQSPELEYRRGQLQRQVEIEQDLYLTLRRNLETARIDEVNDIPLVSVIDIAVPSTDRSPPRRLLLLAFLVLGAFLSLVYTYASWYWETVQVSGR